MLFMVNDQKYKLQFEYSVKENKKRKIVKRTVTAALFSDNPEQKTWTKLAEGGVVCSKEDRFEKAVGRFLSFHRLLDTLQSSLQFADRTFIGAVKATFYENCSIPANWKSLLKEYFPSHLREKHGKIRPSQNRDRRVEGF